MKINTKISSLSILISACFIMVFSSIAFGGSLSCEIVPTKIGSTDTGGPVILGTRIDDPVNNPCQGWGTRLSNNFLLTTANQNSMLAVILTAKSLNKTLIIHTVGDDFGNWKTVHQVYIGNDLP